MIWHRYKPFHITEKSIVDNFIDKIIAMYGTTKTFSIYELIDGNELFIYLKTADTKLSRIFLDNFMESVWVPDPPSEFETLRLIHQSL